MKQQKKGISNFALTMSILGSGIGLGSIWGFPTKMFQYGGITFLIPFFVAIIVCCLPMLIFEINLGNIYYKKTHIFIFEKYNKRFGRIIGWIVSSAQLITSSYYSILNVFLLLSLAYFFFPALLGNIGFFGKNYQEEIKIGTYSDIWKIGSYQTFFVYALFTVFLFILVFLVIYKEIEEGLAFLCKLIMPLLFFILSFFTIFVLFLKDSTLYLKQMFVFDHTHLFRPQAWIAAFGQAFFMFSIGTSILIILSSNTDANTKQDRVKQTFLIIISTIIVALQSSIISYIVLGKEVGIGELKKLAKTTMIIFRIFFLVFKDILPFYFLNNVLAVLFYLAIFFAGFSSLIALIEVSINPFIKRFQMKRKNVLSVALLGLFLISFLFISKSGNLFIFSFDYFQTSFMLPFLFSLHILLLNLNKKEFKKVIKFNNQNSTFKLGKFYCFLFFYLFPLIAIINFFVGIYFLIGQIGNESSLFFTTFLIIFSYFFLYRFLVVNFYKYWKRKKLNFN